MLSEVTTVFDVHCVHQSNMQEDWRNFCRPRSISQMRVEKEDGQVRLRRLHSTSNRVLTCMPQATRPCMKMAFRRTRSREGIKRCTATRRPYSPYRMARVSLREIFDDGLKSHRKAFKPQLLIGGAHAHRYRKMSLVCTEYLGGL